MATKSETVADILREMREDDVRISARETPKTEKLALSYACDWCKGFADRIESAHRREVAELKRQREEALTIVNEVEKCASIERHTEAMLKKNEVIAGLRKEVAELRGALKKAYGTLYSISCSRYGEGLTCTDDIHELVTMARECSDELYANENLRKALEGAKDEN